MKKLGRKAQHRKLLRDNRYLYKVLLSKQFGGCGICGRPPVPRPRTPFKPRRLHMDHDHKTMKIRGLLCFRCNVSLRNWMTIGWLKAALKYLERGDDTNENVG